MMEPHDREFAFLVLLSLGAAALIAGLLAWHGGGSW